jgi:hypothetical protein
MTLITDQEAAKRLARTIISDMITYNRNKLKEGLKNDNLFEIFNKQLEQGRSYYKSKVSQEINGVDSFYDLAIVDVMVHQATVMESNG